MSLTFFRNGKLLRTVLPRTSQCWYTTDKGGDAGAPPEPPAAPKPSKAAPSPPEPFDNTKYKCTPYYEHNEFTFYDLENMMMQSRVGQPSSVEHYNKLPKDVLAELEKSAKH